MLTPYRRAFHAEPSTTHSIDLRLHNNSDRTDTFALNADGSDLRITLSEATITLGPDEEATLTATVTVVESGGQLYLKVNGKTDASSRGDLRSQSLLSHLPTLLHPAPGQALLIGLGSGISLGALEQHPVQRIECVEISPEVVHAAHSLLVVDTQAWYRTINKMVVSPFLFSWVARSFLRAWGH